MVEPDITQVSSMVSLSLNMHPQSMESLKTLLKTQGISLTTEKAISGQIGQADNDDLLKPKNSLNKQNMSGCRLVWFRTLAFQANDPGFKSRRPHQLFLHFKI